VRLFRRERQYRGGAALSKPSLDRPGLRAGATAIISPPTA
jgi:hypothetical protein